MEESSMENTISISTVDRRRQILEQIHEQGQVFIRKLSEQFKVSEVTVRNDLEQLERKNLLIRARGGAINFEGHVGADRQIAEKNRINYRQKALIGERAAGLINEGETIILDSGTTTAEIVKNISDFKKLNIITNALNIVELLIAHPHVNTIIPGGYFRQNSMSLVGPLAERNLRNFYVDKVFLSADGFDTKYGIYTPNIDESHLNQIMIEVAKEIILVVDSSKFKRKSLAFICPVEKLDIVVTDGGISSEDKQRLEEVDIKVIIA